MVTMALIYVAGLISGVVLVAMILAAWVMASYRTIQQRKETGSEQAMAQNNQDYRYRRSWPDTSAA